MKTQMPMRKIFLAYLLQRRKLLCLLAAMAAVGGFLFCAYRLEKEAYFYMLLLWLLAGLIAGMIDFGLFAARHRKLESLCANIVYSLEELPEPRNLMEEDYDLALRTLFCEKQRVESAGDKEKSAMLEYYTLWAHQIKTPIAAARLLLQEDPGAVGTEVEVELLKIEQYVEMVLGYLRLDSESTDYVLRDTDLDGLLRQAVRKFARMFILKKITLDFRETGRTVLTDEKWLSFVVEQVLSNALKYTPAGGRIRICGDGETVVIADSGIGIRPEDLPRVFEKGFTGYNGREDKKSTGIGLYLCRRVMDRLNHSISIVSRPGQGTLVRLDLSRGNRVVE